MKKILFIGLILSILGGCKETKTTSEIDDEVIQAYLEKTNINAEKHASGLYYIIEEGGDGNHPTIYDNIDVLCLGYYTDSLIFQSNDESIKGPLSNFISGWQYGIPLFSKGGKGKIFLPRNLGYNREVLIFDIELRNVWQTK